MSGVVFDTNIWITYQPKVPPRKHLMSVVVLQELVAGAVDKTAVRKYEAAWREYERAGRLLVPNAEDWIVAGRVLNSLLRGLRSKQGGMTPKLPHQDKQRIIRDVLIARTVKRVGALLVTDDVHDFTKIRRFCDLRLKTGRQFFRQ